MDYILPIFYYYLRAITAKPVHGTNEEYFNFKYRETLRSQGRMHTSFKYDRTSRLTANRPNVRELAFCRISYWIAATATIIWTGWQVKNTTVRGRAITPTT
ncbi:hypothetical protein ABX014_20710 [Snodgrassella alvi]|uniref:hypothetical protein n=1 Tax=Snodgrassella alvi TaxID=1196083 RepID=UPI00351C7DC3